MKRKTAFVTGGNGFVGANLVHELVKQGWEVTVFHRSGSDLGRLKGLRLKLKEGSFQDPASVAAAMPQGLDAVFHAAAKVSFWSGDDALMQRDNVEATQVMVEAALRRKAKRFILTSTVSVYGFSEKRINETFPHDGLKSDIGYLRTKAEAEEVVREGVKRGLNAVILNPSNVIGPFKRDSMVHSMLSLKEGMTLKAPPGATSFAHSVEVAKAHVAAVKRGKKGENYILAGADADWVEVYSTIPKVVGLEAKVKALPKIPLQIGAQVFQLLSVFTRKAPFVTPELVKWLSARFSYDSKKAEKELGYKTRSLKDMLQDLWENISEQKKKT